MQVENVQSGQSSKNSSLGIIAAVASTGSTSQSSITERVTPNRAIFDEIHAAYTDERRALNYQRRATLQALVPWRKVDVRRKGVVTDKIWRPAYRVGDCGRKLIPNLLALRDTHGKLYKRAHKGSGSVVKISRPKSPDAAPKAYFHNLIHCHDPKCAVCGFLRTELERMKIQAIYRAARDHGWTVLLATFTIRHHEGEALHALRQDLKAARRSFFSGRGWTDRAAQFGYVSTITKEECTRGDNGPHPHVHGLQFFREKLTAAQFDQLAAFESARWTAQVTQSGRTVNEHGFKLDHSSQRTADYIAKYGREPKWDVDREMAVDSSKTGRREGLTFLQVLDRFAAQRRGDDEAFVREYMQEYRGQRGRTLYIPPKLWRELGIEKLPTMEDVIAALNVELELFACIPEPTWRMIYSGPRQADVDKRLDHAGETSARLISLHRAADSGHAEDVQRWINNWYAGLPQDRQSQLTADDLDVRPLRPMKPAFKIVRVKFADVMNTFPGLDKSAGPGRTSRAARRNRLTSAASGPMRTGRADPGAQLELKQ